MKFLLSVCLLMLFTPWCDANDDQPLLPIVLTGKWITNNTDEVMLDPQTSALKLWRGKLLSLSDGSAHQSQQKKLHIISPQTAKLSGNGLPITLAENLKKSCFANYLNSSPDLEAMVVDPDNDNIIYVVTEDARKANKLSASCQQRFANTGSTVFPSLLVRLEVKPNNQVLMTHVRPLQFDQQFQVGNFANDGIEGMTFGLNRTLYLALEKDLKGVARIFSVDIDADFWSIDDFFRVEDPRFVLPQFDKGNHPINGLDYYPVKDHPGFLVAAARNDDQLWFIDIGKQQPVKVIPLKFMAPVRQKHQQCAPFELMDNTSIEGVGIIDNSVWLINDPWKKHYLDNVQCRSNYDAYKKQAPLLFELPIDKRWLKPS